MRPASRSPAVGYCKADRLSAGTTAYEYPNGYNVSCNACFNGSINATVGGGVTPYTYAWTDGATTEDRSNIGTGNYQITVTDVNGCTLTPHWRES